MNHLTKLTLTLAMLLTTATGAWAEKIMNIGAIMGNYTAQDGDVLKGELYGYAKISIADGATVTLYGVDINSSGATNENCQWAGITCEGDATIILKEGSTNIVKGFYEEYPGIYVPQGKTLTIKGDGQLTVGCSGGTSACAAAIGAGFGSACGNIDIQGGTITATGGRYAAGIGGASDASCGTINISGGTITATGGQYAPGIGCAYKYMGQANCDGITISGGTVVATGGQRAAGIGGGYQSTCGDITITVDATSVTATKGEEATYSIGAGKDGSCGTVNVNGVEGAVTESPCAFHNPYQPWQLEDGSWEFIMPAANKLLLVEYYPPVLTIAANDPAMGTVQVVMPESGPIATKLDVPGTWNRNFTDLTADYLPGFQTLTDQEAKTWNCPVTSDVRLIYGFEYGNVKVAVYQNGEFQAILDNNMGLGNAYNMQNNGLTLYYSTGYTPAPVTDKGDGTYYVAEGTTFTVKATPAEGYHLIGWGDDAENTDLEREITMPADGSDLSLTAIFAENEYDITFSEGTNPDPENPEWTATPNPAKTKQTVTVTYSGTKKVIGVKAEKKSSAPTLKDALADGATVVITYTWNGTYVTTFTFTNNAGTFTGNVTGIEAEYFSKNMLQDGTTLKFTASNADYSDAYVDIRFYTDTNEYYFADKGSRFTSFTISVNGTDVTSQLAEVK